MKHRIRVDKTYIDFVIDTGAEVFTVAENISKNLNLKLEKSDRVLSSLNDSPLSILGKHVRGTLAEQAEVYKGISLCA